MMFEVEITHDDDKVNAIIFRGAEFKADSNGTVRVWLDDEEQMNWHRVKQAVDAEEAAETGDYETEPKQDERETEAWLDLKSDLDEGKPDA